MKSIRKQLKPISLFMAFLVLFVSCKQYDDSIIAIPVESKLSGEELFKSVFFSIGEPIVGVTVLNNQRKFFSEMEDSHKQIFEENIEKLVTTIKEDYPLFLDSFKEKVSSGEHFEVENGLIEGGMILGESISKLVPNFENLLAEVKNEILPQKDISRKRKINDFKLDKYQNLLNENILQDSKAMACSIIFFCAIAIVFYAALAVHNHAAVAAGIYLTFAYWGPKLDQVKKDDVGLLTGISFNDPGLPNENWALYREMLIDELVNKSW